VRPALELHDGARLRREVAGFPGRQEGAIVVLAVASLALLAAKPRDIGLPAINDSAKPPLAR
jgi:hypothetical protein